ncbi:hypothetical protein Nepgr_017223 [Nepenthes gracilis]|uniref:RING-CH-type domain-containing protein n=1 Tax=Nepenthes gracilis TaxID=150966 RepID=A0AAD3SQT3_NEPGR|nr:hypothetical protein Nepgr_017223 [Nepenthes gracilis]
MPTIDKSYVVDIEQGCRQRSAAAASAVSDDNDSSFLYSDAEDGGGSSDDEDGHRCSSWSNNTEIGGVSDKRRRSSVSGCSMEVDLESAVVERKVHLGKVKRDCRICHLSFDGSNTESGFLIELGCSCKEDLAAAHKQCAETWFKIRGNKTCEICGSVALNVAGATNVELTEQWNDSNDAVATAAPRTHQAEARNFWQGHRFLNFLLACVVFAFVISWLFHFNVPS